VPISAGDGATAMPAAFIAGKLTMVERGPERNQMEDNQLPRRHGTVGRVVRAWSYLPRLESVVLMVGFFWNLYGKYYVLIRTHSHGLLWSLLSVSPSDFAFFAALAAVTALVHAWRPGKWSARFAIILAFVAAGWAAANMAWLMAVGVQIHVGVFADLLRYPREFGSIVTNRLVHASGLTFLLAVAAAASLMIAGWRLSWPERVSRRRRRYAYQATLAAAFAVLCLAYGRSTQSMVAADPRCAALSYSSHSFGIASLLGFDGSAKPDITGEARHVARKGERILGYPRGEQVPRPHVFMVVMESTGLWATSLGRQPSDSTPMLSELTERGILFENARIVVTHTTQSQFGVLTGVLPSLDGGFAEAVFVDRPYESLVTILQRFGYRARFCEMVRASFECGPGLMANLGFDSFWSREDLGDPSTHLGYLAGDDFRMIEPAFRWFDQQHGPCFIFFMTSVAHHPYELPASWGPTPADPAQAYLQTIRYTDAFVRQIVQELERRNLFDESLLCVLADHGEGLGRHGILLHNENPFEEAVRVPWIITWPRKVAPGTVVKQPCSLLDVTPTILGLLGLDISLAGFEGVDVLTRELSGRRIDSAGWSSADPVGFVIDDEKVVYWPNLDKAYRYDLAADPQEADPALLDAAETQRIRQELATRRQRCRIHFDPKRFREARLFERWQTSSLGDMAWCYYLPAEKETNR
jgi:phosphoglycerol transferase MdoB-like AlkP superfamily enzyme